MNKEAAEILTDILVVLSNLKYKKLNDYHLDNDLIKIHAKIRKELEKN